MSRSEIGKLTRAYVLLVLMHGRDQHGHPVFDGEGVTPEEGAVRHGVPFDRAGEFLARRKTPEVATPPPPGREAIGQTMEKMRQIIEKFENRKDKT